MRTHCSHGVGCARPHAAIWRSESCGGVRRALHDGEDDGGGGGKGDCDARCCEGREGT